MGFRFTYAKKQTANKILVHLKMLGKTRIAIGVE